MADTASAATVDSALARFRLLRQRSGREELDDLLEVFHAAGLLHALLHACQAGGTRAFDKALRGLGRLRHGLDAALLQLLLFFFPELLQRHQAIGFVLDGDALQDFARLRRQRLPLLQVDQDDQVGREEVGQDAVLEIAIPVQVHEPDLRPGRYVDRAALQRSVKVGGVDVDDLCAEVVGEKGVVDRMPADLEAFDVDLPARVELRFLRRPEVEADAAIDPAEVVDADSLLVNLVEELRATVLAGGRSVDRRGGDGVALGDLRGIEGARRIDHVDYAAPDGAGLLHEGNRLRTAAHLDGELALAGLVRLLDVLEEAAGVDLR